MFALPTLKPKTRSSRRQIDIEAVKDGILQLPGNQYRIVLQVNPVNFELRSENEQDSLIDMYESFLNSLGVPLQILLRIRELDIDDYLASIGLRLQSETDAVYRQQLIDYSEFVRGLVVSNKILTRHFYVVVPYVAHAKQDFLAVKEQLGLRVDIVRKGLSRLGVFSRELTSLQLLDLFYSFYSPEQAKLQPLSAHALHLMHDHYIKKDLTHVSV